MTSPHDPLKNLKPLQKQSISVSEFFQLNKTRIKLTSANGLEKSERLIVEKNLHRPGLALAGFVGLFTYQRLQLFGNTEINYLKSLPANERQASLHNLLEFEIPCIVVTNGNEFEPELLN
ncbi:MAG: HPr kinase/phosphorylase, partial [Bacteroidetes bacterium]|nr:HPr kinase/phosphorylase [Bacteroidota bacterium]